MRVPVGDGSVGAILDRPADARAVLVLSHGAGAGMEHPFLAALAAALVARGVAVLRHQFPFTDAGRRRPDPAPVLEATVRAVVASARTLGLPVFAGGKSMGGRMTTRAEAAAALGVAGIVLVGFPLHPPRTPSTTRARHLADVQVPLLFLQGTRDALAPLPAMRRVVARLDDARLHVVDTADHGFALLARRRGDDVTAELADRVVAFVDEVLAEEARAVRPAASPGRSGSRPARGGTRAGRSTVRRRRTQRRRACTCRRRAAAAGACRRSRTGC